eukprot:5863811-Prymnesium_polylepis.1
MLVPYSSIQVAAVDRLLHARLARGHRLRVVAGHQPDAAHGPRGGRFAPGTVCATANLLARGVPGLPAAHPRTRQQLPLHGRPAIAITEHMLCKETAVVDSPTASDDIRHSAPSNEDEQRTLTTVSSACALGPFSCGSQKPPISASFSETFAELWLELRVT